MEKLNCNSMMTNSPPRLAWSEHCLSEIPPPFQSWMRATWEGCGFKQTSPQQLQQKMLVTKCYLLMALPTAEQQVLRGSKWHIHCSATLCIMYLDFLRQPHLQTFGDIIDHVSDNMDPFLIQKIRLWYICLKRKQKINQVSIYPSVVGCPTADLQSRMLPF